MIDKEVKRIVQVKHLLPFVKLESAAYLPMCGKGEWVCESIYVICAVMSWGVALCSVLQGGSCPKNTFTNTSHQAKGL